MGCLICECGTSCWCDICAASPNCVPQRLLYNRAPTFWQHGKLATRAWLRRELETTSGSCSETGEYLPKKKLSRSLTPRRFLPHPKQWLQQPCSHLRPPRARNNNSRNTLPCHCIAPNPGCSHQDRPCSGDSRRAQYTNRTGNRDCNMRKSA